MSWFQLYASFRERLNSLFYIWKVQYVWIKLFMFLILHLVLTDETLPEIQCAEKRGTIYIVIAIFFRSCDDRYHPWCSTVDFSIISAFSRPWISFPTLLRKWKGTRRCFWATGIRVYTWYKFSMKFFKSPIPSNNFWNSYFITCYQFD